MVGNPKGQQTTATEEHLKGRSEDIDEDCRLQVMLKEDGDNSISQILPVAYAPLGSYKVQDDSCQISQMNSISHVFVFIQSVLIWFSWTLNHQPATIIFYHHKINGEAHYA